jgi:hypothetical protein
MEATAAIKEMEMTREQILQMQASARIYQKLYDDAYASWGMRAAAPTYNDNIDAVSDYRRTEAVRAKKLLPMTELRAAPGEPTFAQLRRTKYWEMGDQTFDIMEDHLLRAVAAAGKRNDSVAWGDPLREIHERDANGAHTVRFLGQRSFIYDMKPPVRRVAYFRTSSGPVRTDGRPVRL